MIGELTGDGHVHTGKREGLVKPLGIVRGLSDLPWHKDCGQGGHSYMCNGLTTGISVTGADRTSGALGVIPGSHRANTMATGRDRRLDLQPIMLETRTGDVTVHCSDTLHRAHPPVDRPRKVVYSSFAPAGPARRRRRTRPREAGEASAAEQRAVAHRGGRQRGQPDSLPSRAGALSRKYSGRLDRGGCARGAARPASGRQRTGAVNCRSEVEESALARINV